MTQEVIDAVNAAEKTVHERLGSIAEQVSGGESRLRGQIAEVNRKVHDVKPIYLAGGVVVIALVLWAAHFAAHLL